MSISFAAPASGGGSSIGAADLEGHVLVVEPVEYITAMTTSFGEKDAVRVTVHDISEQATHEDVLFFGGALIGALKARVGQKVLAVMGKGTAKPGQQAPWVLQDCSTNEAAVTAATAYLVGQVKASLAPEPVAAAPATAPSALDAALGNLAAAGVTK